MEVSKVPLSMSHHESQSWKEETTNDQKILRKNVELFRAKVEKEVNQMANEHAQEIKRLYLKIQEQTKIIETYERKYGKLDSESPTRKENNAGISMSISPKRSFNLQNSQKLNRLNESPIKMISKNSANSAEMGMMLGQDESFESPPDELYKSRYEQRSRMKKLSERDVYNTL
jgi:hypothetical protein